MKSVLKKHSAPSESPIGKEGEKAEEAVPVILSVERAPKRPGPKGRGIYRKKTIDLPPDLDAFVEEARRGHVRPNGQRSTAYSHFIEDMLAAERNRRANEASRHPIGSNTLTT
jgi:hypothetical protein